VADGIRHRNFEREYLASRDEVRKGLVAKSLSKHYRRLLHYRISTSLLSQALGRITVMPLTGKREPTTRIFLLA